MKLFGIKCEYSFFSSKSEIFSGLCLSHKKHQGFQKLHLQIINQARFLTLDNQSLKFIISQFAITGIFNSSCKR
jgi:hypothetical protein